MHFAFQEILQPVADRYLLHRIAQDRINIRIHLVCQIWWRVLQQFLRHSCWNSMLGKSWTEGLPLMPSSA